MMGVVTMNKRRITFVFVSLLIAACGIIPTSLPATDISVTDIPTVKKTERDVPPSALEIMPPNTFGTVDANTLTDKVIFGYQGWFGCPGDGSQVDNWIHWYRGPASISNLTIDYWPDTSELTEDELCPTGMVDTQGNPIYAFSSYNPLTVMRHFYWMAEYGIDGVELQRFATELMYPEGEDVRNQVTKNVKAAAEVYGRFFYIQYDGVEKHTLSKIKQDWKYLVDTHKLTESPQYMHHKGLPLVGIFGLGFEGRDVTPTEALDLINFFQENPESKYRARVLGGVPFFWRTLFGDSSGDPAWAGVYRSFDIISPWAVGRIYDKTSADSFLQQEIMPDLAETRSLGIDYMPVIYPGFSWSNLFPGDPYNQIPRNGGSFYWKQAYNLIDVGVDMIYVAMFDEVDEGTAMFKMVETAEELPVGEVFVPLNIDGYDLPNDWYLHLGGQTGAMLRGEIPLSPEIPELKDYYSSEDLLLKLEIISGADWTSLEILNSEILRRTEITSVEGAFTNYSAAPDFIAMNQSLGDAQAGRTITLQVDLVIDTTVDTDKLEVIFKKGNLNTATLRFYKVENGGKVLIQEVSHSLTSGDGSGQNPLRFSVPLDSTR